MKNKLEDIIYEIKSTFGLTDNDFNLLFPVGIDKDYRKVYDLSRAVDAWQHAGFQKLKENNREIYKELQGLNDINKEKILFIGSRINLNNPPVIIPSPFS